ncbi:ATP-binding protein [Aureitalea marina]|uniref:DNA polymerase III subunit delta n=1 Tax=Aureitalea marina TaxID=930804 RepID=A0A2S7KS64_9FLAO|nr:DNA polymerase III subunit delta' [Aureitalea marina]PQB05469.1 DNA polymerase III subunit delta' [Aureitalea marina]
MRFSEVIGQENIVNHLRQTIVNGRIAHAQLLSGKTGSGLLPVALAYASELLCARYPEGSPEQEQCLSKIRHFAHPDLHFVYPVNSNDKIKKDAVSDDFAEEWRAFVENQPYGSLFDWLRSLGIENKQGNIIKKEALSISRKLSLKSYEGGFKIMLIWMAEFMNQECANTILKLVEEPPEKTVLIMMAENPERILNTIRSRCQFLNIPPLSEHVVVQELKKRFSLDETQARRLCLQAQGDLSKAMHYAAHDSEDEFFEDWFVTWVRSAYRAKKDKQVINELIQWSEGMATEGRETQKKFVLYCLELFRQALLQNYGASELVYHRAVKTSFQLDKFAPFIHQNNIEDIRDALEKAYFHLERNGNSRLVFTDLSIQLTKLIHRPATV